MLQTLIDVIASRSPFSAVFYLFVGVLITGYITIRAQRPKLVVNGHGEGGGSAQLHQWRISITNRPAFFGLLFAGETAKDLCASITLNERPESHYQLTWSGQHPGQSISIEPGYMHSIELFTWFADKPSAYYVLDQSGEPCARFDAPELRFRLLISDRLGRCNRFNLTVKFDKSRINTRPHLRVLYSRSLEQRMHLIKYGLRHIFMAISLRR